MINCLLASTSTLYGGQYLDYLFDALKDLYQNTNEVLFIPYARPSGISHKSYTDIASKAFNQIGKKIVGVHTFENPIAALEKTQGIFTGGGNSFVLVDNLYRFGLMDKLREVINTGTP